MTEALAAVGRSDLAAGIARLLREAAFLGDDERRADEPGAGPAHGREAKAPGEMPTSRAAAMCACSSSRGRDSTFGCRV